MGRQRDDSITTVPKLVDQVIPADNKPLQKHDQVGVVEKTKLALVLDYLEHGGFEGVLGSVKSEISRRGLIDSNPTSAARTPLRTDVGTSISSQLDRIHSNILNAHLNPPPSNPLIPDQLQEEIDIQNFLRLLRQAESATSDIERDEKEEQVLRIGQDLLYMANEKV